MIKRKIIIAALVISTLTGSAVLMQQKAEGKLEHKNKITVIKDNRNILPKPIAAKKTDVYEGITAYDWTDENNMIITKENKALKAINTEVGTFDVNNLYVYNLESKEKKGIGDQSKFQDGAVCSPNNKYIFYRNKYEKDGTGYILDTKGNMKVKILDTQIDPYDLSEGQWINDEELIIPCSGIRGFAIINVNGTINKIQNVEKGIMGTQDPLNGLSIAAPMKVGDKIYYSIIHSGAEDNNKLKVYDIKKKEKKEFVKDEVLEFKVSPNKKQMFILTFNSKTNLNELILIDLQGNQRKVLTEGYIFGAKWSNDGTKIAYISNEQDNEGVYIVDVNTREKSLVSQGTYYIPMAWSPSDKKISVHSKKQKDNKKQFDEIDVTSVINLK